MTVPRHHAAASSHPTLGLIITGGWDGTKYLRSTESTADGSAFISDYEQLPEPSFNPCQVTVDEDTVMLFGGYNGTTMMNTAYTLDLRCDRVCYLNPA